MTLGYCILHANRIDVVLNEGSREEATIGDDMIDLAFGGLSIREPDQLLQGYLDGMVGQFQQVIDRVRTAAGSTVGLFADLQRFVDDLGRMKFDEFRATPWVDRAADLLAALEPVAIAGKLDALLERLATALPELNGGGLLDRVVQVVLGGLDVFEHRRLAGADDLAAHRGFRMARIIRAWITDALADARAKLAEFDLIAWIRQGLAQTFAGVDSSGAAVLRELGESLRTKLRPIALAIDALLGLRVSVRVEAQTLPDQGDLWLDENLVSPHPAGHWLWILDLVSGGIAFIETIFDVRRFNPFHGARAGDAILSILNLAWQGARTIVRAARPKFLVESHSRSAKSFWFSELGDFSIQLLLNLIGSFHEAASGSNWAMSFACRLARWYSFSLQPRIPYLFARAVAYQQQWANQAWVEKYKVVAGDTIESIAAARGLDPIRLRVWNRIDADNQPDVGDDLMIVPAELGDRPGRVRAPMAFGQHVWLGWAIAWLLGAVFGLVRSWSDYEVNKLTTSAAFWVSLVLALVALIVLPGAFSKWTWPDGSHPYEIDYLTFTVFAATFLLVVIMLTISMYSTNVLAGKAFLGWLLGGILFVYLFFGVLLAWRVGGTGGLGTASISLYIYSIVIGLLLFNVVTSVLWWTYVDDGRDKLDEFKRPNPAKELVALDASKSPYKLPWKKDAVWMCGQGFHGIFSHLFSDPANHFGYDFLETFNQPASAARGGLVAAVKQDVDHNTLEKTPTTPQNDIHVQHLDWIEGHDPGTNDERILTSSEYIHIGKDFAHVHVDQFVLQGQNVVNIDSTGISAQHHLHFSAVVGQSVDTLRVLATVDAEYWAAEAASGGAHLWRGLSVPGRKTKLPGIYHSSHPAVFADESARWDRTNPIFWTFHGRSGTPGRPISQCLYQSDNTLASPPARPLRLTTKGGDHQHELTFDLGDLPLAGKPAAALVLWTTVVDGHRHRVTLTPDAVVTLLGHRLPAGLTTETTLAHTHEFAPEARSGASGNEVSPLAQIGLTTPPGAQLVAAKPGPYDLLGHRMILRVDDAATEFHHFAGDRARLLGDLAIDRLPANAPQLTCDPLVTMAGSGSARAATREGLLAIDASTSFGPNPETDPKRAKAFVVRAIPVLVLETVERGRKARLAVERPGSSIVREGTGSIEQRSISLVGLRDLFASQLNAAPVHTAPTPTDVHALAEPSATKIDVKGAAVVVAGAARVQAVFEGLYEPAAQRLHGLDALPLGPARALLDWGDAAAKLEVPLVGGAAQVELDPAAAWLTGAKAHETPLRVRVGTTTTEVRLTKAETLGALAQRLPREVEGIRAWEQAGKLIVETLDFGPTVSLGVDKAHPEGDATKNFSASGTGDAPKLAAANPIQDSSLIERDELIRAIGDAANRADLRAKRAKGIVDATKVAVQISVDGKRIKLELPSPKKIKLAADPSARLAALLNFTNVSDQVLHSAELADPLILPVDGWIDLDVDGDIMRVYLDGQPARVELPPFASTWQTGDKLRVQVGAASEAFTDIDLRTHGSVLAAAGELAKRAGLIVRISHRVAIEARHPGFARVQLENGGPYGFVRRTRLDVEGVGPALDLHAVADDFGERRQLALGVLDANKVYVAKVLGAGANSRVSVEASPGQHVRVEWLGPGSDPLGFEDLPAPSVATREFASLAPPVRALHYRVELLESSNPIPIAATYVQLGVQPASLRATRPAAARPLVEGTKLSVEVGLDGATQTFELDLGWAAKWAEARAKLPGVSKDQVATELRTRLVEQLQREVSGLDVWLVPSSRPLASGVTVESDRLQFESRVAGKQARLRLLGDAAIQALGFDPDAVLGKTIAGAGDANDGDKILPAEIQLAFSQAIAQLTVLSGVATIDVRESKTTPGKLELSASALVAPPPAVTLTIEPPELRAAIPTTTAAGKVEIDASAPLDLPGGRVIMERGGTRVSVLVVHGTRAGLGSLLPAAGSQKEKDELAWLAGFGPTRKLSVEFDAGSRTIAAFPAGQLSLDAAIAYLAEQVPELAIGIRPKGTGRELYLESRVRGASSRVALRFIGFSPGTTAALGSLFGFTEDAVSIGSGTFHDLAKVDRAALLSALRRATTERMQALPKAFSAVTNPLGVSITALDGVGMPDTNIALTPISGEGIEGLSGSAIETLERSSLTPTANQLQQSWLAPRAIRSSVVRVRWHVLTLDELHVASVPLWGAPARLDLPVKVGRTPTAFRGRRLAFRVDGSLFTCTFAGSTTKWTDVVAQLERASTARLMARVVQRAGKDVLILTSASEGKLARLELQAASGGPDARDLIDLPSLVAVSGQGSLDKLSAVTATDLANALDKGIVSTEQTATRIDTPIGWNGTYVAGPKRDAPRLRLRSSRVGCSSAVEAIVGGEPFEFDLSMRRGPAVAAAVVVPTPAAGKWTLTGKLTVEFDDSGAGPAKKVEVEFPAGDYLPDRLARVIHEAVFANDAGVCGAFPDGSVVVETRTRGLAGSVRLTADPALLNALGLTGGSVLVRGWPGLLESAEGFRIGNDLAPPFATRHTTGYYPARGFRASKTQLIKKDVGWRFHDGEPSVAFRSSAWIDLDSTWSTDQLVQRVDAALRAASLGHAKRADDGTLQIEAAAGRALVLQVRDSPTAAGREIGLSIPDRKRAGERIEVKPEPGLDLRPTDTLRTLRLIYDRTGKGDSGVAGGMIDAGWIRAQNDPTWGLSRHHETWEPVDFPMWSHGRYLLAARAEAAKQDYGRDGEMVVSSGKVSVAGKDVHFVRVARYWIGLTGLQPGASTALAPLMNGVRMFDGQIVIDWSI
ncbi:LysM peptidoglycan-binding domain-containing protein [Nannocystaceae bacterium ST9]